MPRSWVASVFLAVASAVSPVDLAVDSAEIAAVRVPMLDVVDADNVLMLV